MCPLLPVKLRVRLVLKVIAYIVRGWKSKRFRDRIYNNLIRCIQAVEGSGAVIEVHLLGR